MTDSPADAPRPQGRYPKGIARRQEILDKAIEVFAQRGAKKTSLRAIAQEVGVTHAALTHYFGSLEELLVAVYRESERRSDETEPDEPGLTPAMGMRLAAEKNRDIPGLVQLYSTLVATALEESEPQPAQEFITARFARLRAEISAQVRELQASGRLRSDLDPGLVAALVIAASDGLQTQWLLDPAVDHEGALEMLDRLLAGGAA
ncbi:TetR/AcrR family transcriptional regulator [Microbacterium hydrocarbonoxydans]|uniref:TetR/AcrR family transcriptional regulator n=1 Tax=Microbacterium hydrocarbonoxydans TaxID=273678 RepID=UPI00082C1CD6|nr:TetR/AcrR family transcriptional regulator [Microbacterium hydrocarbonoxydans]